MKTPRIRHARRREFDGAERGSPGVKRLQRHNLFLANRAADATTGIGDTAAAVAIATALIASVAASGVLTATGNPVGAAFAAGVLTGTTIANGNTVTVDDQTYTFVTALSSGPTVPNEILVGVSDSDSLDNLIAAINGAAGAGTTYSTGTAQPTAAVTAAAGAGDTLDLTADVRGTAGNAIATTAVLTAGDWGAATLVGGLDGDTVTIGSTVYVFDDATQGLEDLPLHVLVGATASDSLDNLIAAITAAAGAGSLYGTGTTAHPDVTAAAGAGDTVDVDALVAGAAGNAIATVCTPTTRIDFAAATLEGGLTTNEGVTATTHGYDEGDGPFVVASDTTLPAGLVAGTLYWIHVIDADTFSLHLSRREAALGINPVDITDAGTGNHTILRAATRAAFNAYLREGVQAGQLRALTDVDNVGNFF